MTSNETVFDKLCALLAQRSRDSPTPRVCVKRVANAVGLFSRVRACIPVAWNRVQREGEAWSVVNVSISGGSWRNSRNIHGHRVDFVIIAYYAQYKRVKLKGAPLAAEPVSRKFPLLRRSFPRRFHTRRYRPQVSSFYNAFGFFQRPLSFTVSTVKRPIFSRFISTKMDGLIGATRRLILATKRRKTKGSPTRRQLPRTLEV